MKRAKSENVDENLQRQPYLSGAYIRSFVKQLTSKPTAAEREADDNHPMEQEQEQADSKPKKQVRRRLQTRKPYQEKLLNMAEARREIVTALKLHRAAMKQPTQIPPPHQSQSTSTPDFQTEQKSRRNPRIYADVNFVDNNVVYWSVPNSAPPPPPPLGFQESFDFELPSQALGLNLNVQDFITAPSSIYSSSPPPPPPRAAEIRSGFLNCVETRGEHEREEELASSPFDEVMEFPAWLNANESCLHDFCAPDYFQEPPLPCMEIEEIEGMDGDWLA